MDEELKEEVLEETVEEEKLPDEGSDEAAKMLEEDVPPVVDAEVF